jgi:hypothetical protein
MSTSTDFVKVGTNVLANATAPMVASGDDTTWPFVDFVFQSPVVLAGTTNYLLVVRLKTLGAVQVGLVSSQIGMAWG